MEYMLMPLRRYADFSGRSRRKEYWMFALGLVILYAIMAFILGAGMLGGSDPAAGLFGGVAGILFLLILLAIIIPSIAVQVRRFHDQDKSGWFVLLNFLPYLGSIVVLVFMCLEGTRGPNRFGPDPKGPDHTEVFS